MTNLTNFWKKTVMPIMALVMMALVLTAAGPDKKEKTKRGGPDYFVVHCEFIKGTFPLIAHTPQDISRAVALCKDRLGGKVAGVTPVWKHSKKKKSRK